MTPVPEDASQAVKTTSVDLTVAVVCAENAQRANYVFPMHRGLQNAKKSKIHTPATEYVALTQGLAGVILPALKLAIVAKMFATSAPKTTKR